MTALSNTAEGGSDTTDVTTGNSGADSGTAWDLVQRPTGATVKFSATQRAHGLLAYQLATAATAGNMGLTWDEVAFGSAPSLLFVRHYLYLTALPTVTNPRVHYAFNQDGSASFGGVGIVTSTNFQRHSDGAGSTLATGTVALAAATWYRFEEKYTLGTPNTASNATIESRLFLGEATLPLETLGPTTFTATGTITGITPGRWGCGSLANWPTATGTDFVYQDNIAASDVDWIGASGTPPPPRPNITAIPFMR